LQEEYLTAKRLQKAGVAKLVQAVLQRMHLAGMTEDQIQFVDARGTVQTRLPIYAPVAGVVAELKIREGMTVMTGAPMFTIHSLRSIWVNAEVPEAVSAQLRAGDAVEARTPALPGVVFRGEVNDLLPEINQATRTRTARIEIANPQGKLVPGMFASVRFAAAARKAVLSVPVDAVIDTGKRSVVMVAEGEGKFVPVDVETGFEASGRIEIRKGLKVGQKVVVSGQFLIDSEASLRGTTRRMSDPTVAKHEHTAGPNTGATHRGEGKVEHIDTKEIVLSHGPIPTLQSGAMTMGLRPPSGGMPANVKAGDSVVFDIRQTSDGMFELTWIAPAPGRPASPAAAPVPEAHQHNHAVHQHPPAR
jgi:Cu(I)/Ag(I) efflux system membrane fusion protein